MSSKELASLFVDVALQRSLLEFSPDDRDSARVVGQMNRFLDDLVSHVRGDAEFLKAAMLLMNDETHFADERPADAETESLYRAFDRIDDILGIRYSLDLGMSSDPAQSERLYEGAGIGVQTSYPSILLALRRASPREGARVLDLGSGYGRVGFVIGLLRPDISFAGYEYVDHRVRDAIEVAARSGFAKVDFFTQDLSRADFKIPTADIYYMYDPFSRETYGYVLDQLLALGETNAITIITKGRANTWVEDAVRNRGWTLDNDCDRGFVTLFHSPAKT